MARLHAFALLLLPTVLCGCPAPPNAAPTPAASGPSGPRFSCFDHYPAERIEQHGYTLELYRIRVLPWRPEFYAREPFLQGDITPVVHKASAYFVADIAIHKGPEGAQLSFPGDWTLKCGDVAATPGGFQGTAIAEVDQIARAWAILDDPVPGGGPVELTLTTGPEDARRTFTFKVAIPKEAFFWSDGSE